MTESEGISSMEGGGGGGGGGLSQTLRLRVEWK